MNKKKEYIDSSWEIVCGCPKKENDNYLFLHMVGMENNRERETSYCGIYMKNLKYIKNNTTILFITLLGLFAWNEDRNHFLVEESLKNLYNTEKKKC